MAKVTGNSARAAAIVGFLIICCGIPITTCGVIWVAYGGYQGHGLWSGIPLLATGFFGFVSLTRNNCMFILYIILAIMTAIGAGIQSVTAGLELNHWNKYIGNNKCSVQKGACTCIGFEKIRIDDLDSCDKIPTINDLFITMIFFSICGTLLCGFGAIAGLVGLTSVPRSQPTTLPRKPKSAKSSTLTLEHNNYKPNDTKKQDQVDNKYKIESQQPKDQYYDKDRREDYYPEDRRDGYYDDRDRLRDDRRRDDYDRDRYRDDRRDDYERDRYRDDRRDDYYDRDRYDRDDRRDDYHDRDRYRDDYDRYSDRSYGRDSYDRRSYDRDSYYDDRRSQEGRKTPTYL